MNGVSQDDFLSPLLFCLVEEVLSKGISYLVDSGIIKLIKCVGNCQVPLHSLFAYDIMDFFKGVVKSIRAITNLLKRYADCSRQLCNTSKYLIYAWAMA